MQAMQQYSGWAPKEFDESALDPEPAGTNVQATGAQAEGAAWRLVQALQKGEWEGDAGEGRGGRGRGVKRKGGGTASGPRPQMPPQKQQLTRNRSNLLFVRMNGVRGLDGRASVLISRIYIQPRCMRWLSLLVF